MEDPRKQSNGQVKSRARVRDHGEVFTAEREVKAMCDLVREDSFNPDSTFLEPACGDGNFLAEILARKLSTVARQYGRRLYDWETRSLQTLGSLYGVDILGDNVLACRDRLFKIWDAEYARLAKGMRSEDVRRSARFVLEKNVVRGNALSMRLVDESARDTKSPIVFSQWTLLRGATKMRREDFEFASLLAAAEADRALVPDAVPGTAAPPQRAPEQADLFAEPGGGEGRFLGSRLYPSRRIFDE